MDIITILERIDLQALAEEAGARFNNNHSSRCPLHHGNNPTAFHLYQGQDGVWRYHCFTNCPEGANGGDAVSFYMRWRNVDFKTALLELGRRVGVEDDHRSAAPARQKPDPIHIDPADEPPCTQWRDRALSFVEYAQGQLWTEAAQDARDYLMLDRGLTETMIRTFCLGYNPHDRFDDAARWGDPSSAKHLWCPRGIVIPHIHGPEIWFVNVRRPLPGDGLARRIGAISYLKETKFVGLRGGKRGLFGIIKGFPILVLAEGEFDTMLAWQSAGDLCDVGTLGGARHRLDTRDAATLTRACVIISMLDDDKAGQKGNKYLHCVSPSRVFLIRPPDHDLTDAWRNGVDLRAWIAGIVAQKMEPLIRALNQHEQPEAFAEWMDIYQRAVAAEAGCERG